MAATTGLAPDTFLDRQTDYALASMAALAEAIAEEPFSPETAEAVRGELGNASGRRQAADVETPARREQSSDVAPEEKDPPAEPQAAEPRLVAAPAVAVAAILRVTGVELTVLPPVVLEFSLDYAPPAVTEEDASAGTKAFELLFRLESQLRALVERRLSPIGPKWFIQRCPGEVVDACEKRRTERGRSSDALLLYADLGDLQHIICCKDNWPLFEPYFKRREGLIESFARLVPLHKDVMQMRLLSGTDMMTFYLEAHRIWRAIDVPDPDATPLLSERAIMEQAVNLSRGCQNEDPSRTSPSVAAIVARNGQVLGAAFRGELRPGDHAEYTLLEKKLPGVDLTGTTLFTTLEPCTKRNPPKKACVRHIIDRGISKVAIGMLDPNRQILGRGCRTLIQADIAISFFDSDLMTEIERINGAFTAQHPHPLHEAVPIEPIEIDFGEPDDESFAGLMTGYDSPEPGAAPSVTTLISYLGYVRLVNHDPQPAAVDRFWISVDGAAPVETLKNELEGTLRLEARAARVFRLDYAANYPHRASSGAAAALKLHVQVIGLGEFSAPLPSWARRAS